MLPANRLAPRVAAVLLLLALAGCDEDGPPPGVLADIDRLRAVMIDDPAHQPLEEVERIAADRPVHAARMLRTGGLPAARQQVTRVESATMTTDEGRGFARRLAAAYRDRVAALEQYREVLEAGAADAEALMAALHAQSDADRAVLAVDAAMEEIAPTELQHPEVPGGPPPDEDDFGDEADHPGVGTR